VAEGIGPVKPGNLDAYAVKSAAVQGAKSYIRTPDER
jgi:hypothetical protein